MLSPLATDPAAAKQHFPELCINSYMFFIKFSSNVGCIFFILKLLSWKSHGFRTTKVGADPAWLCNFQNVRRRGKRVPKD